MKNYHKTAMRNLIPKSCLRVNQEEVLIIIEGRLMFYSGLVLFGVFNL